jgi:hypothetical protein
MFYNSFLHEEVIGGHIESSYGYLKFEKDSNGRWHAEDNGSYYDCDLSDMQGHIVPHMQNVIRAEGYYADGHITTLKL